MESSGRGRCSFPRGLRQGGDGVYATLFVTLLLGVWGAQALEMSAGKVPFVEAMNGSTVLIPCTYSSCIGIKNLYFNWQYNDNGTMVKLCEGLIPAEGVEPRVNLYHDRLSFVGTSKSNNISILLWNISFEDDGEYTCFGRNPKEKGRNHSTIFTLIVVDQLKVIDNTLTTIITSVVGGVIGLLIVVMVTKSLVQHFLHKNAEKNKECLVSSTGNDNTDNGLSGAKGDNKATAKA